MLVVMPVGMILLRPALSLQSPEILGKLRARVFVDGDSVPLGPAFQLTRADHDLYDALPEHLYQHRPPPLLSDLPILEPGGQALRIKATVLRIFTGQ